MILSQKPQNWSSLAFGASALFCALLLCFTSAGHATTASPIIVSSTAVTGSTVTVTTAAAHGLVANQGFCNHSFTTAYCGVVVSAPSSTTFTFTQTGAVACAATCGSIVPAKKIIWLVTNTVDGGYSVNYLLWLTTQQPVARAGATSAWPNAATEENNAIAAGTFLEISRTQFFPLNTSLANAEAQMVNDYNAQQSNLAASVQPGQFYGNFFDTGWLQ